MYAHVYTYAYRPWTMLLAQMMSTSLLKNIRSYIPDMLNERNVEIDPVSILLSRVHLSQALFITGAAGHHLTPVNIMDD